MRISHRLCLLVAAVLAATIGATACGSSAQDSPAGSSSLTLGWTPGPAAPQIPIAVQDGSWSNAGLDVTISKFTSGREVLESMLGGGVDVAVLAELPMVTATLRGQDLVVLGDLSSFSSYEIIARKDRGITDVASLAGKRIATTTGTNMQFMADQVLSGAGVHAELVNVAPPDIVASLAKGDVDAGVMFESFYPAALQNLGDNAVRLPVDGQAYTGHMLVVTTRETLNNQRDALQKLMSGITAANTRISGDAASVQQTVSNYVGAALPLDYLRNVWSSYAFGPALDDSLAELMAREGAWVTQKGFVQTNRAPDIALMKGTFVPSLTAS